MKVMFKDLGRDKISFSVELKRQGGAEQGRI